MMKIRQFRYAADNLSYLVYGDAQALVIDGGAGRRILQYADAHGLSITAVTHTHAHPDHTAGTRDLAVECGADYLDHRQLARDGSLVLDGEAIGVLATPGHTMDSVTFSVGNALITGDTLFNGTVGNCFSGDLKSFYESVEKLLGFPEETVVYAGHDYVEASVAFARELEPANPHLGAYLAQYDPRHVRSTLADERKVNPFLRFNEPPLIRILSGKGLAVDSAFDRWCSVMTL